MALLDYRCDICGAERSLIVKLRSGPVEDQPMIEPPLCLEGEDVDFPRKGHGPMRRRFAKPGIVFKGDGWTGAASQGRK